MSAKGRLAGKSALVTAAAQGIGKATCLMFANEGCKVIATDINEELLKDLEKEEGITTRRLDVTNRAEVEALAKDVGNVDILFNCAGYVHQGTILDCEEEIWDKSFEVNVKSMYFMCKAFIPKMVENEKGSIINMSSVVSSVKGLPARFAYGTSKAAVIGLTKSLAVDFVERGVRVNCICPGTVDTPSFRQRVNEFEDPEKALYDFMSRQKMGRLGTPEEIAALVTHLASEESAYTTGSVFVCDGGLSA